MNYTFFHLILQFSAPSEMSYYTMEEKNPYIIYLVGHNLAGGPFFLF